MQFLSEKKQICDVDIAKDIKELFLLRCVQKTYNDAVDESWRDIYNFEFR